MAGPVIDNIEKQFVELPRQIQFGVLERLIHLMGQSPSEDERALSAAAAEMAADPQIQREIADINREFRTTEMDGLSKS